MLRTLMECMADDSFDCQRCKRERPMEDVGAAQLFDSDNGSQVKVFCTECTEVMLANSELEARSENNRLEFLRAEDCAQDVHERLNRGGVVTFFFDIRTRQ